MPSTGGAEAASKDFSCGFVTEQSPETIYAATLDVRGWWSRNIEGPTDVEGAEWTYHNEPIHMSRHRTLELVPGKRVVWAVEDGFLNFIANQQEWVGDRMVFEITPEGTGHRLTFTQHGLTPDKQCYYICDNAWSGYVMGSLRGLVETGHGAPIPARG
ncbi:SRPBCC domain-containing protein [Devosia sp.]|uniref:SRPBCC domain-containing protein n=1 Tax=Devosia sp. TaxID=1871048 RepID=UPI003A955D06